MFNIMDADKALNKVDQSANYDEVSISPIAEPKTSPGKVSENVTEEIVTQTTMTKNPNTMSRMSDVVYPDLIQSESAGISSSGGNIMSANSMNSTIPVLANEGAIDAFKSYGPMTVPPKKPGSTVSKRPRHKASIRKELLNKAVQDVINEKISMRQAAQRYNIAKSSLCDYVRKNKIHLPAVRYKSYVNSERRFTDNAVSPAGSLPIIPPLANTASNLNNLPARMGSAPKRMKPNVPGVGVKPKEAKNDFLMTGMENMPFNQNSGFLPQGSNMMTQPNMLSTIFSFFNSNLGSQLSQNQLLQQQQQQQQALFTANPWPTSGAPLLGPNNLSFKNWTVLLNNGANLGGLNAANSTAVSGLCCSTPTTANANSNSCIKTSDSLPPLSTGYLSNLPDLSKSDLNSIPISSSEAVVPQSPLISTNPSLSDSVSEKQDDNINGLVADAVSDVASNASHSLSQQQENIMSPLGSCKVLQVRT